MALTPNLLSKAEAQTFIQGVIEALEKKGFFYYTVRDVNKGNQHYVELELSIKVKDSR